VRLSCQLGKARPDDVVDVVVVRVREQRLPERRRMHRQQRSDLEQLQARVRPEDVDAAGVRDTDADGLADPRREQLRPGERA
jgi:hypothetical protein